MAGIRKLVTKKRLVYVVLILVALAVGWYFFVRQKPLEATTITVTKGEFVHDVSVTGKVVPEHSADLGFVESGRIAQVFFDVGSYVAAGTVIARIENNDQQAQFTQKLALLNAEQALLDEVERLENTGRSNSLSTQFIGGSSRDGDSSLDEIPSVQRGRVQASAADVLAAQANLDKTLIVAPFTGIITKMDLKAGNIVSPSGDPQVSMMSNTPFEIESYVPEIYIGSIKVGNTASTTLDAYGDGVVFNASVVSIDPAETVQDTVSTYKVKLRFEGPDVRIKSGMSANIDITTERKADVIVVPDGVVIEKNDQHFVEVIKDETRIEKNVTVGKSTSRGQVEIVSGLEEGDEVVINPNE